MKALSIDKKLSNLLISSQIEGILYSVFERAINLKTSSGELISVVSRENFNGPNTVVVSERFNLSELFLNPGSSVISSKNGLYFEEGLFIGFDCAIPWEYSLSQIEINPLQLRKNLLYFASFFPGNNLLCPEEFIRDNFLSFQNLASASFLSENVIAFFNAIKDNNRGRIKTSLGRIIGSGEGLTPAGDDFIVGLLGVLYSFSIWNEFKDKANNILSVIKEEIDIERTNFISSRFLSFSLEGRFSQPVFEFLDLLFSCDDFRDDRSLRNILSYGASSGNVIALGILSGSWLLLMNSEQ